MMIYFIWIKLCVKMNVFLHVQVNEYIYIYNEFAFIIADQNTQPVQKKNNGYWKWGD